MSRVKKQVNLTYATAESPAMSEHGKDDKERLHLSPDEFKAQLKRLGEDVKDLVNIARKVGSAKTGLPFEIEGEQIGPKELVKMRSTYVKTLNQLKKNYAARGIRKKRSLLTKDGKVRKPTEGFGKPSFLEQPMIDFLMNANFGMVPGTNQPLRETFREMVESYTILSHAIITQLMTIYVFLNKGARYEEDGKTWYKATPEMLKYLGAYIQKAEDDDAAKPDSEMVDTKGNLKQRFNRNKFGYQRLQNIVTPGIVKKADVPEEKMAYLTNDDIKATLKQIKDQVSQAKEIVHPTKEKKAKN